MLLVLYSVQYLAIVVTYQAKGSDTSPALHHTEPRKMNNLHNSLISTALLALQTSKQVNFDMECTESGKSGFWCKKYANEDQNDEIMVELLIYLSTESATGYGIQVDVLDDETYTIVDQPIASFEEFQAIFASGFVQKVYDAY